MNAYKKQMIFNGTKISTMAFMNISVASTWGDQPRLFEFISHCVHHIFSFRKDIKKKD